MFKCFLKQNVLGPPFLTKNVRRYVAQTSGGCGQACLAMVLDKDLEYINNYLGHSATMFKRDILYMLHHHGYINLRVQDFERFKPLPKFCLIFVATGDKDICHCLIIDGGQVVDPARPGVKDLIWLDEIKRVQEFIRLEKQEL